FAKVSNEGEVQDALRRFNIPPGDYMLPNACSPAGMKSPEFQEKFKKGPVLVMTVFKGGSMNMGGSLAQWFLYLLIFGVFAAEDYTFEEMAPDGAVRPVKLSELFAPGKDSLIVYSYMYGPNMKTPCTSCTSIIDGLDASAAHVTQRTNLVVVAKSPIQRIMEFTKPRGWNKIRILSSNKNSYNKDYFAEDEKESQNP